MNPPSLGWSFRLVRTSLQVPAVEMKSLGAGVRLAAGARCNWIPEAAYWSAVCVYVIWPVEMYTQ
jgi:hypothetical protein